MQNILREVEAIDGKLDYGLSSETLLIGKLARLHCFVEISGGFTVVHMATLLFLLSFKISSVSFRFLLSLSFLPMATLDFFFRSKFHRAIPSFSLHDFQFQSCVRKLSRKNNQKWLLRRFVSTPNDSQDQWPSAQDEVSVKSTGFRDNFKKFISVNLKTQKV